MPLRLAAMRSPGVMLAAAVALAGFVLACSSAVAQPVTQPAPFLTGIYADRPEASGADAGLYYDRIVAAGARIVRFTVYWKDVAPATLPVSWDPTDPADSNYNWGDLDQRVELAVAHHLTPLITLMQAPVWAQVGGVADDLGSYRPSAVDFGQFAAAVARRYSGAFQGLPRVRYWQAWNEPNITAYLEPLAETPSIYRSLLSAFADSVHAAAVGNLVVSAGLSPFTVDYPTVKSIGPMQFMRELLCMSGGAHPRPTCASTAKFDIWATHPYTTGGPFDHAANPNDVSLGDLPKMNTLLQAAVKAGHVDSTGPVGFWVTEFSWDTDPPDPNAVPVALQARWTAEALYQMWSSGVSAVIWLMLRDDAYPGSPLQSGLYFRSDNGLASDKPKPALVAFRFPFVAYLRPDGVEVWGRTPTNRGAIVVIERRSAASGPWRRVASIRADRYGIFDGVLKFAATRKNWVRARLIGSSVAALPFSLTEPPDHMYHPFG